ncbi:MAG: hypothetical protein CL949_05390 [Erythrobacter sp.]|nr:hypothetical protein [Erythrobacter sp.]|tara:strand:- start:740 stop:1240 length:501 start_codon:yes stop_codon:yes gene_type:complete
MMWGKKRIAGSVYDLTHLDPFNVEVEHPSGKITTLQVQFGPHTFTEAYTPLHTPDLAISNGGELRAFCLKRYAHSLRLPAAVEQAVGGEVCNNSGKMVINSRLPGLSGPYLIAFKLRQRQSRKFDGVMTVVTAHHRPNLAQDLPVAPFHAVLSATFAGRKINWKKK